MHPEPPQPEPEPVRPEPMQPEPVQWPAEAFDLVDDPAPAESEHSDWSEPVDDVDAPAAGVKIPINPGQSAKRPRWTGTIRRELAIGLAAIAGLIAVGLVLLVPTGPSELNTAPHLPPISPSTPGPVIANPNQLSLAEPTDLGNQVVLTWTSSETLDYAVIIAEQGNADRTLLAYRNHTMTIPVDPLRKYCFLVQGTNGSQIYQSVPVPVRGATCHL